jgi:type III pantothenate kinase
MLLAIDIGNSNIGVGVFSRGELTASFRLRTEVSRTPDEYEATMLSIGRARGVNFADAEHAVMSTVVPEMAASFVAIVERLTGTRPLLVRPDLDLGLEFEVGNPSEVGTDLLANAVAGYRHAQKSCLMVDFGTAISITSVAEGGVFRGVSIAPGLETAMKALTSQTAQLPHVSLTAPERAIGTNTTTAIQSGVVLGYASLVDGLLERMSKELPGEVRAIATGGLVETMRGVSRRIDSYVPALTLEGLQLIAHRVLGIEA